MEKDKNKLKQMIEDARLKKSCDRLKKSCDSLREVFEQMHKPYEKKADKWIRQNNLNRSYINFFADKKTYENVDFFVRQIQVGMGAGDFVSTQIDKYSTKQVEDGDFEVLFVGTYKECEEICIELREVNDFKNTTFVVINNDCSVLKLKYMLATEDYYKKHSNKVDSFFIGTREKCLQWIKENGE